MKKKLFKQAVVAVLLTSSIISFSPAAYGKTTSIQQTIDAVKMEMKKATISFVEPAIEGKIVSSSSLYPVLNSAKKNYKETRKAIQSSKLSNSVKQAKLKEIDALYNEKIVKGLIPYIDAYNYASKYLVPIMNDIKIAEDKNDFAAVEKAYHKLSVQLKSRTSILYRFTGKAARDLLLDQYKEPADNKRDELMVPVTIYMKIVEIEKLLNDGKKEEALMVYESVQSLVEKLTVSDKNLFVNELLKEVEKVKLSVGIPPTVKPSTPPSKTNGGNSGLETEIPQNPSYGLEIGSILNTPGSYGPVSGNKIINGNLTVNSPGISLRNLTINGDLIISEAVGEGDVKLEGVKVQGKTIINGGGENSIYFTDSVLATVIVNKNTGTVRIVAQGNTQVFEVQLETPTRVVEQGLSSTASGFENVTISEAMQSVGSSFQVQLEGEFETINSRASNIRINLGGSTDIRTLILNAATQILGTGNIQFAEINANGSTLSQRPQNVVLNINNSVSIGGESVSESYSDGSITETFIRSINASQGSISLNMSNYMANLSVSDFTVVAKIDGQHFELQNISYNPNQQRLTFDTIDVLHNIGKTVEISVVPSQETTKIVGEAQTTSFVIETGFAGRITDIQGVGISNLTIKFRQGSGTREGNIIGEATTDRYGYYSVNIPAGIYTGEFSGPGYVTSFMIGTSATDVFLKDQDETAIRAAASNEVKIMLSWDENPRDLDSHLTGPGVDGSQFHVWYSNKQVSEDGVTYVDLDWDDTESYGPETTTIRKLVDGEYRFYIHHYSGESTLSLSGAQVKVFKGSSNTPNHTFSIPQGEGDERYWIVFDMKVSNSGETIEIVPIDKMINTENIQMTINDKFTSGDAIVNAGSTLKLSSSQPGTKIYYTADGSQATIDSAEYTAPILINESTTINAIAVNEGIIVGYAYGYFEIGTAAPTIPLPVVTSSSDSVTLTVPQDNIVGASIVEVGGTLASADSVNVSTSDSSIIGLQVLGYTEGAEITISIIHSINGIQIDKIYAIRYENSLWTIREVLE